MILRQEHNSDRQPTAIYCIRSPLPRVSTVVKTISALFLLGASLAASLRAQPPVTIQYGPGSLDQLVAPIALYPDPLIALILPASTASTDVVLAARYFEQNANPAQIDAQPWDPSVKALAHYPDLITWMDANLAWTQALGQAYATQPDAVMRAIQEMRARAQAAGSLQSTPQQQVVLADGAIEILPAQPSEIYLPCYDPAIVYDTGYAWGCPLVTFGMAFPIGPWLSFACDWREHRIWRVAWTRGWDHRRDGRSPATGRFGPPPGAHRPPGSYRDDPRPGQWQHPATLARTPAPSYPPRHGVAMPSSTRSPFTGFRNRTNPRPGVRPDVIYTAPSAPVPYRGPTARFAQTGAPRIFSNRSWGSRPAFTPVFRAPAQYAATRTAPRTANQNTRR